MATEKMTITRVSRKDKISKAGKPFVSLGIQTDKYEERWLSGFGNKENAVWKEGTVIEVEVVPKGEYLNFEMPKSGNSATPEFAVGNAEVKNILILKGVPMLQAIYAKLDTGPEPDDFQMPSF